MTDQSPSNKRQPDERHRVLSDHKRVGKRFIPPMLQIPGGFEEMRWIERPLPELLWLAFLHDLYGYEAGSQIAIGLARAAASLTGDKSTYAATSAYTSLDGGRQRRLRSLLEEAGFSADMERLATAVADLVSLYPKCPLSFLVQHGQNAADVAGSLERVKKVLRSLFDKTSRPATHIIGAGIGIALETRRLIAPRDATVQGWRGLAAYPDTDESRKIAAGCRATINVLFGSFNTNSARPWWPEYFWDRGLELEPCRAVVTTSE